MASRSNTATLRLQLEDLLSGPAKGAAGSLKGLDGAIKTMGKSGAPSMQRLVKQLEHLKAKAGAIENFAASRRGLKELWGEVRSGRAHLRQLEQSMAGVTKPTAKMKAELRSAQSAVQNLTSTMRQQVAAARSAEASLKAYSLNGRSAITSAQTGIREQMAKTIREMRRVDQEARRLGMPRNAYRMAAAADRSYGGGAVPGAIAGGYVLAQPARKAMTYDEQLTYVASTMAGGGTLEEKQAAKTSVSDAVDRAVQQGGGTREGAANAMNTLVSSGAFEGREALDVIGTVVKTAHASGADADDIARMATAMKNNGVRKEDLQRGFDVALRGGQLGAFELRDMAKWMPQQLALVRGSGLTGLDAVRTLTGFNQASRTTAGTADEAGNNVINLLQKINSRELRKTMGETIQPKKGDPLTAEGEFDWSGYMVKRREQGGSAIDALGEVLDRQVGEDPKYQDIMSKLDKAEGAQRQALLSRAADIAENSAIGEIFADRQALMAALAWRTEKDRRQQIDAELGRADGAVQQESAFVRSQTWSKTRDAGNTIDRANQEAYDSLSGPLGSVVDKANELARAFPGVTAGLYGLGAAAAAVGAAGLVGRGFGGWGGTAAGAASGAVAAGGKAASLIRILSGAGIITAPLALSGSTRDNPYLAAPEAERQIMRDRARADTEKYIRQRQEKSLRRGAPDPRGQLSEMTVGWPRAAEEGMLRYQQTLQRGGDQAEAEAAAIAAQIQELLSVTATPNVDTSRLERALGLARQVAAALSGGRVSATTPAPASKPLSFGGPRAKGGPVQSGKAYVVGEQGPEVLTPGRSGHITPNRALGGVTVNQTISITVQGGGTDTSMADALRKIEAQLTRSAQVAFGGLKSYGDA